MCRRNRVARKAVPWARHCTISRSGEGSIESSFHIQLFFSSDRLLETTRLQPAFPVAFAARDGLGLEGYLTVPSSSDPGGRGRPSAPVLLVLLVHDGPWARDRWVKNSQHQLFASRGYAVLSVNYRGSRCLGKPFLNAGNGEWGGKMQTDLDDAVAWAVASGIADKSRVAIVGEGFGGYAALMGLALRPDTFACGVDINGPVDLAPLLTDGPAHQETSLAELSQRIGDPGTPAGAELLRARSPISPRLLRRRKPRTDFQVRGRWIRSGSRGLITTPRRAPFEPRRELEQRACCARRRTPVLATRARPPVSTTCAFRARTAVGSTTPQGGCLP